MFLTGAKDKDIVEVLELSDNINHRMVHGKSQNGRVLTMTKIYMAPMEGLTGYMFRQKYERYFGKGRIDKYFIPFISPNSSGGYTLREMADISRENNIGINAVPQIMANASDMFLNGIRILKDLGYREVNLNVGCPSGTVVAKKRGAGFLSVPDELDRFLYEIMSSEIMQDVDFSVKTRLGVGSADEFYTLLDIFNRYSLKELIIHPRVRADYYGNIPDMDMFKYAYENSRNTVSYNGDIKTKDDYVRITTQFSDIDSVMIGRGFVADPAMINAIKDDSPLSYTRDTAEEKKLVRAFVDEIFEGYREAMGNDTNAMHRMKEIWVYMASAFVGGERYIKDIKKAQRVCDYTAAVDIFFSQATLKG